MKRGITLYTGRVVYVEYGDLVLLRWNGSHNMPQYLDGGMFRIIDFGRNSNMIEIEFTNKQNKLKRIRLNSEVVVIEAYNRSGVVL